MMSSATKHYRDSKSPLKAGVTSRLRQLIRDFSISTGKVGESKTTALLAGLALVAAIPRILGALLLINGFGDGYAYAEQIEAMRAKIIDGAFATTDLFGFWLPMYQFLCAAISAFTGDSFLVAKLFSAVCGTGICLLAFHITLRLTANGFLSLLGFALVAFNPLHILYSSFSMTEAPHAFMGIASLYLVIKGRWTAAAIFAAVAGLMRIEGWILIALLPLLQFFVRRRVSPTVCMIAVLPVLLWFYISWATTGNALEYFEMRNRAIAEFFHFYPNEAGFSLPRLALNLYRLIYSTNIAVLSACFLATFLVARSLSRRLPEREAGPLHAVVAVCAYFFSFLGFILLAYVTKNQPAIWERYGLILFALGIPVLMWIVPHIRERNLRRARVLSLLFVAACLWQWGSQFVDMVGFIRESPEESAVADYLKEEYRASPDIRIFCDDSAVRVLSGIPMNKFLNSYNSPRERNLFLSNLKSNGVRYLVYADIKEAPLARLFPELGDGEGNRFFRPVMKAGEGRPRFRIYRFQAEQTRPSPASQAPQR